MMIMIFYVYFSVCHVFISSEQLCLAVEFILLFIIISLLHHRPNGLLQYHDNNLRVSFIWLAMENLEWYSWAEHSDNVDFFLGL